VWLLVWLQNVTPGEAREKRTVNLYEANDINEAHQVNKRASLNSQEAQETKGSSARGDRITTWFTFSQPFTRGEGSRKIKIKIKIKIKSQRYRAR
jgi:hypothetical protein